MRNYAASARARLLALSRESGRPYQQLLLRYACERFLYRLSLSEHRDRCILKGASLLGLWMSDPYRSTRDLDFLAYGPSDGASVKELVASICSIPCLEDGITFDMDSLRVEDIREETEYGGQRAKVDALLERTAIHLQIDFGFGDAVEPVDENYPAILPGLPTPRVRAYPREYVVAEKFGAMLTLGRGNSRMKDFHDLWALSRSYRFELPSLAAAVAASLDRRGIALGRDLPDSLSPAFYEDEALQTRWTAYRAKGIFLESPPSAFSVIGSALGDFLSPLREAIIFGEESDKIWPSGGPWK